MASLSLDSLLKRNQRSINFIHVKTDYTSAVLDKTINYGLIATFLLMVFTWVTLWHERQLLVELNTINRQIDEEGAKVDALRNKSVDAEAENGQSLRFETKFLATQKKLLTYKQMLGDEKMMDLFGILSAIIPEGVWMQNLSIQPHHVDVNFFVSQGRMGDDLPLKQFAANLREVNNATFQDGKKLHIDETDISKISMAADSVGGSGNGYEVEVSFDYDIIMPEENL